MTVHGRSFFASRQGTPATGTAWKLGAVGTVGSASAPSSGSARPAVRGFGWSRFSVTWRRPEAGGYTLLARATDLAGRQQPLTTPFNDNGYFFDAAVAHPVTFA